MRRFGWIVSAMCMMAAPAFGLDRGCFVQARQDMLDCRSECTNDFRNARFLCHDVENGCGRECLGGRETCIETAVQPLVDCLGVCGGTLETAKGGCRESCGQDEACVDTCIDQAQVDAFTCRDNCRESFRTNGGQAAVDDCRDTFRSCVDACPHSEPPR